MVIRFRSLFMALAIFLIGFSSRITAKEAYHILFIQSYTERDTWSNELNEGLADGFKESGLPVRITTEYLNSRYWRAFGDEELIRQICKQARESKTDLIVTSNDEALISLLTCEDTLPPTVPIVFTGVQFPNYKLLRKFPNVTGSTTPLAFDQLLNTMKEVFPDRKRVIVLSEDISFARWGLQSFKGAWRKFIAQNAGYTFVEFNVTIDPLTEIVSEIQYANDVSNSIVVVPYWGLFMSSIAKVSKAPTFSTSPSALMQGGFCVVAPYAYDEAFRAAKTAAKILKGTKPADIAISESAHQITYDYKQLDFFHIKKNVLPKNGVVINQPYINKYGIWYFALYLLSLSLLVLLIVRLVAANRRESRRRMHVQTKLLIQERLVAQRNEFDNVFHSIRDGVITYDMDSRIHFVNKSALSALELADPFSLLRERSYEGKLSEDVCVFIHDGENILPALLEKVSQKGISVVIPENTFAQTPGAKKYFSVSGEIVPLRANGKQIGMVLSFRNISAEALQKRYYNLAVMESSIYPWQFDPEEGLFTFPLEYVIRMGLEQETLLREDAEKRIHPDDLQEAHRLFSLVIKGEKHTVRITFRQKNASGLYEWWEFRVSTIGRLLGDMSFEIIGVCQSIQRYKSTEEALIVARDNALQSDKLKTAFLANMSHEIRTPLNAIVGFSDLLRDFHQFGKEDLQEFVETINKNCELLLVLISDILDMSRIESGKMDFQYSSYFLPIIIQEIYDSQSLNMPPGVAFVKHIPEGSEKVIVTDSIRIKQVLNNLINNAVKFTEAGSIAFGYVEDEPGYVTFFVEDTGIGLIPEDRERIFERFYKVDNFTQGAGLGLSITQTIITRLNGTISVESEKNKGTRFAVRIPDAVN